MTLPTLLFALLVALLYGAVYHLIRDGGFWRLLLYLSLSLVGFTAGFYFGIWRGWVFLPFGSLDLGTSSMGSLLFLLVGDWLSRLDARPESKV
jgi:hypothetical protein